MLKPTLLRENNKAFNNLLRCIKIKQKKLLTMIFFFWSVLVNIFQIYGFARKTTMSAKIIQS